MRLMATALRKSRGLIELMGQYEIRFADDDDNGDGNGEDNKAVYTAISVACGWAGAVLSLC